MVLISFSSKFVWTYLGFIFQQDILVSSLQFSVNISLSVTLSPKPNGTKRGAFCKKAQVCESLSIRGIWHDQGSSSLNVLCITLYTVLYIALYICLFDICYICLINCTGYINIPCSTLFLWKGGLENNKDLSSPRQERVERDIPSYWNLVPPSGTRDIQHDGIHGISTWLGWPSENMDC